MQGKRKTHIQFVKEVYDKYGNEYSILGQYKNCKTKLEVIHNSCGKHSYVRPDQFIRGTGCKYCYKNERKTTEQFKQEVFDLVGNEYEVIGEYIQSSKKVKFKHNNCGEFFQRSASAFIRNQKCPICNVENYHKKITSEQFYDMFKSKYGEKYTIIEKYINMRKKIKIQHNDCGFNWEVSPEYIMRDTHKHLKCPNCEGGRIRNKTTKYFKQEVYNLVGDEYKVLSEYSNAITKIKMLHILCNHEYEVTPSDFLKGRRCPSCVESKGEKEISKLLINNHISYRAQFKFDNCKYKKRLPFDFAVFNNKNELISLIEYDGEQHFKPVEYFGGEDNFKNRIKKDQIKNIYCTTNNILLIRIPYWEFNNIEYILENVLIHYKLINTENNTYDKEIVNKYLVDSEWNHDTYLSWNDKDKRDIPMKCELMHN